MFNPIYFLVRLYATKADPKAGRKAESKARAVRGSQSLEQSSANRASYSCWHICLLASIALITAVCVLDVVTPGWTLFAWALLGTFLLLLCAFTVYREQVSGVVVTVCLCLVWIHLFLVTQQAPVFHDPTDLQMTVVVESIPQRQPRRTQADVVVVEGHVCRFNKLPCRVRLSWYRDRDSELPLLVPGQRWRVSARLKPLWGYANPGGFDYATWLKRRGIAATGYVRGVENAVLEDTEVRGFVSRLRMSVMQRIRDMQPAHPSLGLLIGLAVGVRSDIDDRERQVLVKTGTAHLLAISGMHIGMIASVGFIVGGLLWRMTVRSEYGQRQTAHRIRAASIPALVLATGYALLAGFTLPTQRALLTLLFVSGLFFRRQRVAFRHVLLLVLCMALLVDPLSVLSAGLWLSFGAVGALIWVGGGRPVNRDAGDTIDTTSPGTLLRFRQRAVDVIRIQLALSVLLIPLTVAWFGQLSLIAPLANLIAIPLVGVLVLPLLLLALLLEPVAMSVAAVCLGFAGDVLSLMMRLLTSLAGMPLAGLYVPETKPVALLAAILAALCLTKPAGGRLRWLALPVSLPFVTGLLVARPEALDVHVLDVGQGQAIVVESGNYVLLYDTGAGSGDFSAFRRVIQPFFRSRGIRSPDLVVISHADNDHAGGLSHLRSAYPDVAVISPAAFHAQLHPDGDCHAGLHWQYRDVEFEVLYPFTHTNLNRSDNNLSCVLLIRYGEASILIPGDIEARAESELVRNWPLDTGTVDLLIAPHHGSASSSGASFVERLQPVHVVFSAGRWNRYKFPDDDVAMRYKEVGSSVYQTGLSGSIHFSFNREGTVAEVHTHRRQ